MEIPKRIITVWLNDDKVIPGKFLKWIDTHNIDGYEHFLITKFNSSCRSQYYMDCMSAKKWVKAADYLRIYYLAILGGIYLDADMEVLPGKNFNHLLNVDLFAGREENGFIANSVIGSVPNNPVLIDYLKKVETNFLGRGDMIFEPGMRLFCDMITSVPDPYKNILPADYFFPYNHQTGETKTTDNTITYHHFTKTWLKS